MRQPGIPCLALFLVFAATTTSLAQVAPIGAPFAIAPSEGGQTSPLLATRPDGTYLVVWKSGPVLAGRFLGPAGAPITHPFTIAEGAIASPAVAVLPDGGFVVVWEQEGEILGSAHDRDGRVRVPRFQVAPKPDTPHQDQPGIAAGLEGGWMVVWREVVLPFGDLEVFGRWFAPDGTPGTAPTALSSRPGFSEHHPGVVPRPDGGFLTFWAVRGEDIIPPLSSSLGFAGRLFDAAGVPMGSDISLSEGAVPRLFPLPGQAGFMLANEDPLESALTMLRVDAEGTLLPGFLYSDAPQFELNRSFAVDAAGRLLLVGSGRDRRTYGQLYDAMLLKSLGAPFEFPTARPARVQPVLASAQPGQFLMVWEDKGTLMGEILAAGCEAPHLGLCLADSRFRVEVSWRDHDGNTGQGHAVPLEDDTGAFWFFSPSNVELLVKVLDGRGVNGHFWVFYGSLSDVEYEIRVTDTDTGDVRLYRNPSGRLASHADVQAFPPAAGTSSPVSAAALPGRIERIGAPLTSSIECSSSDVALCLDPLHRVTVDFVDPRTGATRQARAVPFSRESGAFWFFDPENLELFVKVLDGTAVNGHVWVFHGALTDVEYTLTVQDLSGPAWTYHNPRGRMHSGADTSALPPAPRD